jgi:hypothetical protein
MALVTSKSPAHVVFYDFASEETEDYEFGSIIITDLELMNN